MEKIVGWLEKLWQLQIWLTDPSTWRQSRSIWRGEKELQTILLWTSKLSCIPETCKGSVTMVIILVYYTGWQISQLLRKTKNCGKNVVVLTILEIYQKVKYICFWVAWRWFCTTYWFQVDHSKNFSVLGKLSYDAPNERVRIIEEVDLSGKRYFYDYIILYREVSNARQRNVTRKWNPRNAKAWKASTQSNANVKQGDAGQTVAGVTQ